MSAFKNRKTYALLGWFGLAFFATILGCGSGEIENFAGIQVVTDFHPDRIYVEIYLLDERGNPLIWNASILSPEIGVNAVNESKFKTNAQIYSTRQGKKGIKVYDGRLIDLHWTRVIGSSIRLMRAEIPRILIARDLEADSERGFITVTIQTDKQGPFSDTAQKAQIYSRYQ